MLGPSARSGLIAVHPSRRWPGARSLVGKGTLNAVIVIPAGFSAAVQANRPASMQVIGNVDSPISTQIARSIAEGYAAELNRVRLSVATVCTAAEARRALPPGRDPGARGEGGRGRGAGRRSVTSRRKPRNSTQKSFYAAGMAVFFLFFTVQFGVTSLLEERNDGTLARLLAAPITRASILGGKLLTSFLARA